MALTRDFKNTVAARAQRDPRFREALLTEAINAFLGGDTAAGKAILRDLVNATLGFEKLAAAITSCTVLYGLSARTTSTFGMEPIMVIGWKFLTGS